VPHHRAAPALGVTAWREAPPFTVRKRAALVLTEALARIADKADPVQDELWHEASAQSDKRQLSGLILAIGAINVWNRIDVAIRQPAGRR